MKVQDSFKLDGRIAVITGGGRGLGFGMAEALAEAGAVAVIADIDFDNAVEAVKELNSKKYEGYAIKMDVCDRDSVASGVEEIIGEYGRIDILVNNAGMLYRPLTPGGSASIPLLDVPFETWKQVIDVNLIGVFNVTQAVGKYMIKQNSGNIINIASLNAFVANVDRYNNAYCASKGGLMMFTRQLATEWAQYGIRINAIAPGYMRAAMGAPLDDPKVKELLPRLTPLKREGTPEDLKGPTVFLASEASAYMTGQAVIVDGGYSLY